MGRTVLGQQIVRPPDDKLVHHGDELFELLLTSLLLLVCGIQVSPFEDDVFVVLSKFKSGAEDSGIRKAEQRVVFGEIVLHWCAGEQDATLDVDGV